MEHVNIRVVKKEFMELDINYYPFTENFYFFSELNNKISENQIFDLPIYSQTKNWDNTKKSKYIESILLHIPPTPLYLFEDKKGVLKILDGFQRLRSIRDFMKNEFRLLSSSPVLNGKLFSDFSKKLKLSFKYSKIRINIAQYSTSSSELAKIYGMLNGES